MLEFKSSVVTNITPDRHYLTWIYFPNKHNYQSQSQWSAVADPDVTFNLAQSARRSAKFLF
jgi:hypothetical protein